MNKVKKLEIKSRFLKSGFGLNPNNKEEVRKVIRDERGEIEMVYNSKEQKFYAFQGKKSVGQGALRLLLETEVLGHEDFLVSRDEDDSVPNLVIALRNSAIETKTKEPKSEIEEVKEEVRADESKESKPEIEKAKEEVRAEEASGIIDRLTSIADYDVIEIFGDTGTGKSQFCLAIAKQAEREGKRVLFIDTERNISKRQASQLKNYIFQPQLEKIPEILNKNDRFDLIVIDSIGLPVLGRFASLSTRQRGDAFLKMIALLYQLKQKCYKDNSIAIVTNQPESEFMKSENYELRPFGDKSQFMVKEILKTEIIEQNENETKIAIKSFRSRTMPKNKRVCELQIKKEVIMKW